jgi:hypothetical protein
MWGKVQSRAWPFSPLLCCRLENGDEMSAPTEVQMTRYKLGNGKSPTFMQHEFLSSKILLLRACLLEFSSPVQAVFEVVLA